MTPMSAEIVARAEALPGLIAGIARLDDLLEAPSYRAVAEEEWSSSVQDEVGVTPWPAAARSVLVLGLHHPEDEARLDWWDGGHSLGDRRLLEIGASLAHWLQDEQGIGAHLLPYHVERGGAFLKDAAVLAGLGVVGRSNLLVTPTWGPRIRLRAMLLEGDLEPTGPLEGFSPCGSCAGWCQSACPRDAFFSDAYHRPSCVEQMEADEAHKIPDSDGGGNGSPTLVVAYCRACELACPVGIREQR